VSNRTAIENRENVIEEKESKLEKAVEALADKQFTHT
jgi:hypothetical protein